MAEVVLPKPIHRFFESGDVKQMDDEVIAESRLHLHLDGEPFLQATISPSLVEEFVIGFLRTRGLIESMKDISSLELKEGAALVARTPRFRGERPNLTLLESTGSRNVTPEEIHTKGAAGTDFRVAARSLIQGVRLLAKMPLYIRTGGTHCAILFSTDGDPLTSAEDIGRHNAVDKVIGSGMKKRLDFDKCWLAVSGRLPADMVLKPALLGIPLVASVSAPTTEGIEMGRRTGIAVVGFTRGGRLNAYTCPERIMAGS